MSRIADDFAFAWEGPSGPEPFGTLEVLELRGREALSTPYAFWVELAIPPGGRAPSPEELLGARAALRLRTAERPGHRLIHGVISALEELADVGQSRLRVTLSPPFVTSELRRRSLVFVDKPLAAIVESTLGRRPDGAGLTRVQESLFEEDDGSPDYVPAEAAYWWRILDWKRLGAGDTRPHCVQYDESDWAFVARLLEEEGIAYHFEHTRTECLLVLSDEDGGMDHRLADAGLVLGPERLSQNLTHVRVGARLRPSKVSLHDYEWRKPDLSLRVEVAAGRPTVASEEQPGGYGDDPRNGEPLARTRAERYWAESRWVVADSRCRLLGPGAIVRVEHPHPRATGDYLITAVEHQVLQRQSFGQVAPDADPYLARVELLRLEATGGHPRSGFRPARSTPKPRAFGVQTAFVTGATGTSQEPIPVGGPEDIGCVRIRFPWDDPTRVSAETPSVWARVSQLFAGSDHGALFHPRVGEEVLVSFIGGDPDRPIVTGRVYNAAQRPPGHPAARPTLSVIQTRTVPENGNFNLLSFDDQQGEEQIRLHAARDHVETVLGGQSTSVGGDKSSGVGGDRILDTKGSVRETIGADRTTGVSGDDCRAVGGHEVTDIGKNRSLLVGVDDAATIGGNATLHVKTNQTTVVGGDYQLAATTTTLQQGRARIHSSVSSSVHGAGASVHLEAGLVSISNGQGASIQLLGNNIILSAAFLLCSSGGAKVKVQGGEASLSGARVSLSGDAAIDGTAPLIQWNG